jgi:hypothetical protein
MPFSRHGGKWVCCLRDFDVLQPEREAIIMKSSILACTIAIVFGAAAAASAAQHGNGGPKPGQSHAAAAPKPTVSHGQKPPATSHGQSAKPHGSSGTTHGSSGSTHGSSGSSHGNGHATTTSTSENGKTKGKPTTTSGLTPVQQKLQKNTNLASKLQSRLPAGTDLMAAAAGFRNLGQFVAAVNVSNNLGISFTSLKSRMVDDHESLGQAIHDLRPNTDQKVARQAESEANTLIRSTQTTTQTTTSTSKSKSKTTGKPKTTTRPGGQ